MIAALLGTVIVGFLAVLVFGLVTGRVDWRQQGCCDADPTKDPRMSVPDDRVLSSLRRDVRAQASTRGDENR